MASSTDEIAATAHLGANVYCWGEAEQRVLLREGLRQWAADAKREGLAERIWYCRYDVRGPHVFAVFSTTEAQQAALREFMDRAINDFIGRFPSRCSISHEELEKRHHSCRGRAMSQIDRMASIAENNSFTIFGQRSDEYPFTMGAGMAGPDEFWTRMDSLAFWTLEHLHEDSAGTSIRWLVEVDRSLDRLNAPARDYWCLHTASLLAPTEKDWLTWGKKTGPSIRSVLSRQNEETFSTFWNDSGASIPDFDVNGLIAAVMSETCLSLERRFRVLREINHLVLGQLGLLCKFEIPVVVHAWQRRLTL